MNTKIVVSVKANEDNYYIYIDCIDYYTCSPISLQYCKSTYKCRIKLENEWYMIKQTPSPFKFLKFKFDDAYFGPCSTFSWETEND